MGLFDSFSRKKVNMMTYSVTNDFLHCPFCYEEIFSSRGSTCPKCGEKLDSVQAVIFASDSKNNFDMKKAVNSWLTKNQKNVSLHFIMETEEDKERNPYIKKLTLYYNENQVQHKQKYGFDLICNSITIADDSETKNFERSWKNNQKSLGEHIIQTVYSQYDRSGMRKVTSCILFKEQAGTEINNEGQANVGAAAENPAINVHAAAINPAVNTQTVPDSSVMNSAASTQPTNTQPASTQQVELTEEDKNRIEEAKKLFRNKKYKEALNIFFEYGEVDSDCAFSLGYIYGNGYGVERDDQKACYWYTISSKLGESVATLNLGRRYQKGNGVEKDEKKAFALFEEAAKRGEKDAMYELGVCYDNGLGTEKNEVEALKWYKKAIESGRKKDYFDIAYLLAEGSEKVRNESQAISYYELAVEEGSGSACCNLGVMYLDGTGVEKDPKKAIHYYTLGVERGSRQAMYNLACNYQSGEYLEKDLGKALQLFEQAADKGHESAKKKVESMRSQIKEAINLYNQDLFKEAMETLLAYGEVDSDCAFSLGYIYGNGCEVERDDLKAVHYYEIAAKMGHKFAQWNLARRYHFGTGIEKDETKAFALYGEAAKQGYLDAMYLLARCYDKGIGTEKNEVEALNWYKKAIESGRKKDYFDIAYLLAEGSEKVRDQSQAISYYLLAVEEGSVGACCNLGAMYMMGEGVEKDPEKAIHYYTLGVERGGTQSMYNLACNYQSGTSVEKDLEKALQLFEQAADKGHFSAKQKAEEVRKQIEEEKKQTKNPSAEDSTETTLIQSFVDYMKEKQENGYVVRMEDNEVVWAISTQYLHNAPIVIHFQPETDSGLQYAHIQLNNYVTFPQDKIGTMYKVCNDANSRNFGLFFSAEEDTNSITVKKRVGFLKESCGQQCLEEINTMKAILDEEYSMFMKAIWA